METSRDVTHSSRTHTHTHTRTRTHIHTHSHTLALLADTNQTWQFVFLAHTERGKKEGKDFCNGFTTTIPRPYRCQKNNTALIITSTSRLHRNGRIYCELGESQASSGSPIGPPSRTNMLILMNCDLREIENVNNAYGAIQSLYSADVRAVEAGGAGRNIHSPCGPLLHCVRGLQASRPSPPQLHPWTVHSAVSEA